MAKKSTSDFDLKRFGHYAFIVGIIFAVVIALFDMPENVAISVLVILGLIVGLLNITARETMEFLIAALVLMVTASTTALILGSISTALIAMWRNVMTFIGPAAIVVAIKTILVLAEKR